MGEEFNPYYKWLAIPLNEQPPHHYRLLGVTPFESSEDVISNAADQRMAFLRTFQSGPHSPLSQKLLNEIAAARLALLDPKRKTPYDESLRAQLNAARTAASPVPPPAPPPPAAPPLVPMSPQIAAPQIAPPQVAISQPPLRRPVPIAPAPPAIQQEDVPPPRYELVPRSANEHSRRKPTKQTAGKGPLMIGLAVVGLLAAAVMIALVTGGGDAPQVAVADRPADNLQSPADNSSDANTTGKHAGRIDRPQIQPDPEDDPSTESDPEPNPPKPGRPDADPEPRPVKPAPPSGDTTDIDPGKTKTVVPVPNIEPKPVPKPEPKPVPQVDTPTPPPTATTRLAEPAADALAAANLQIKEVFRKDLLEASSPGMKRMLAEKLLRQADTKQDEPPIRFGLYQQALHLATEAADVAVVLEAIDSESKAFVVDPHALALQALQQLSKSAKPADQQAIGRAALDQIQPAMQADELAIADKLAQLAHAVAIKIRDLEMRKAASARIADIKKVEQVWKEARPAAAALEKDPDDDAANLTYGSYLCLVHGDWAQGLPLLAKGGDGKLSAAARLDLQPAGDPAAQVQVGDAWWHLANDEKGFGKTLLLERAGHWYSLAAPKLTGLTQTRIEKRLQEIAHSAHEEPLGRRPPPVPASKVLDMPLAAGDANANTVLHLRWLPAGKFIQGSPPKETGHQPFETQHEVVLTKPFFMGITEVTQAQWQAVMGNNPSNFKGPDVPVHNVSYTAAKEFCERLDRLPANRGNYQFRLPTSAEWEYACRAGSLGTFCYGDDPAKLGEYAWYKDSTKGVGGPRPVAQLKPNAAGLYDMHGNVNEWCTDSFSNLILSTRQVDPKGFPGVNQVVRGGYGMSTAEECRCAHIFNDPPGRAIDGLGFRVVCDSPSGKK